jgi:hypothetical protein
MSDRVPEFAGQDSGGIRTAIRCGPDRVPVYPDSVPGHPDSSSTALRGVAGRDRESILSEEVTQNVERATGRLNLTALCPEKYSLCVKSSKSCV